MGKQTDSASKQLNEPKSLGFSPLRQGKRIIALKRIFAIRRSVLRNAG
jgi:hypothetical protein